MIDAYITNLGKYNEGHLIGEWVKFPTTYEALQETFKRIDIDGIRYEEWFITDYECNLSAIQSVLGEYESLDALNYLAINLDALSPYDIEKLEAVLEHDSARDIKDLINLTENLDGYDLLTGVNNEEDLGTYWIEESGAYDLKAMGNLATYIDYERFGRDIALDEGGTFTDHGYVRETGDSQIEIFSGSHEDIPLEYLVTRDTDKDRQALKEVQEPISIKPEGKFENTYEIYQLKRDDSVRDYCYEHLDGLSKYGLAVKRENYDLVYQASLAEGETLEGLYQRFNLRHPADFRGHSMSVSDVVVLHKDGVSTAHYCDSFGFADLSQFIGTENQVIDMKTSGFIVEGHDGGWHAIDFKAIEGSTFYLMEHDTYGDDAAGIIVSAQGKLILDEVFNGFDDETVEQLTESKENWLNSAEMSTEDDYGMLDSIINNGVPDARKREEKPSVLKRLKDLKTDVGKETKMGQVVDKIQEKLER